MDRESDSTRRSRAVLCCSPGIDVQPHAAPLNQLNLAVEPLSIKALDRNTRQLRLYLIDVSWWASRPSEKRSGLLAAFRDPHVGLILAGKPGASLPADLDSEDPCAWLDLPPGEAALKAALRSTLGAMETRLKLQRAEDQLLQRTLQMEEVCRVGIALSAEHDQDSLQELVIQKSREITGADAGTLYLLEEREDGTRVMVFHVAQCDSVSASYTLRELPLDRRSIAGYVAATGQTLRLDDVYHLPSDVDYAFRPTFDQEYGYRSRSMLVAPMKNHLDEVIGVIQLINRKRHFSARLVGPEAVEGEVEPFTQEDERLLSSFASQAAVALENRRLLTSIQNLFRGFVQASVTAIEARDPATRGHSDRVARMTVGLARAVNRVESGRWKDVGFTLHQIREIEYAGLLHDFGKVGVREDVLVKAKKLYPWQLGELRARFRCARESVQAHYTRRKLDLVLTQGPEAYRSQAEALAGECAAELARLEAAWEAVVRANEPSILGEGGEEDLAPALAALAGQTILTCDGEPLKLIEEHELKTLTLLRGTLDESERREIESHVNHTFNFLIQIPWTSELKGVPEIAYAHHEKLNGAGYPRRLRQDEIPIQTRMMTIADIFDALTARDRPYKAAVPAEHALDILQTEARDGAVDPELLDLFTHGKIYHLGADHASGAAREGRDG